MADNIEQWHKLTIEEPIDPDLPICDPHHHLWDYPGNRYLLHELMQDIGGGHNVVKTVFVECSAMYRPDGPVEMRPVGETESALDIAMQSVSDKYSKTAVAAGIVGFADLTLGADVEPVLEAHIKAGGSNFRGIRHSVARDANPEIRSYRNSPRGLMLDSRFREGFACLEKYGLTFDAWLYHP
ncbi:MAG: amidohydrolase, partial [Deltaproteobacteria bacterium]|nr:amidohydrolase [Deltaproteobacteria bacterium]